MTSRDQKYVAKAEPGVGWRIWNRRTRRWWGNYFSAYPEAVLAELNALARPGVLVSLCRASQSKERMVKNRGNKKRPSRL